MAYLSLEFSGALVFHVGIISSSQKAHKVTAEMSPHRNDNRIASKAIAALLHDLKERWLPGFMEKGHLS